MDLEVQGWFLCLDIGCSTQEIGHCATGSWHVTMVVDVSDASDRIVSAGAQERRIEMMNNTILRIGRRYGKSAVVVSGYAMVEDKCQCGSCDMEWTHDGYGGCNECDSGYDALINTAPDDWNTYRLNDEILRVLRALVDAKDTSEFHDIIDESDDALWSYDGEGDTFAVCIDLLHTIWWKHTIDNHDLYLIGDMAELVPDTYAMIEEKWERVGAPRLVWEVNMRISENLSKAGILKVMADAVVMNLTGHYVGIKCVTTGFRHKWSH